MLYKFPDETKLTLKFEILVLVWILLLPEKFVRFKFKVFVKPLTFRVPVLKLLEFTDDNTLKLDTFKLDEVILFEMIFTELVCELTKMLEHVTLFVSKVPPVFVMFPETFRLPTLELIKFVDDEKREELEILFVFTDDIIESPGTLRLADVIDTLDTKAAFKVLFKFTELAVRFVIDTFDRKELLLTLSVPIVATLIVEFEFVKFVTTVFRNVEFALVNEFDT